MREFISTYVSTFPGTHKCPQAYIPYTGIQACMNACTPVLTSKQTHMEPLTTCTYRHIRMYIHTRRHNIPAIPKQHKIEPLYKSTDHTTSHIHSTSLRRDSFSRTTPLTVMATVKSHANVITIGSMICMASVYLELEWNQCQRKRLK